MDSNGNPGRRHRFDPSGPAAGLFFLVVAGVFLATALADEPTVPLEVLATALLIGLGAVGIIRVLSRGRRRDP